MPKRPECFRIIPRGSTLESFPGLKIDISGRKQCTLWQTLQSLAPYLHCLANIYCRGEVAIPHPTRIIASIAGSDSSAGAGVQADLKTASALGTWCHCVVSALTAQSPAAVHAIAPVPIEFVIQQLDAIFSLEQFSPQALKTGMLGSAELTGAVATYLLPKALPLVVDTVFKSTTGQALADENLCATMVDKLFPLATLVTPNLAEAACLLACDEAREKDELIDQAKALYKLGAQAVLIKGGHLQGPEAIDILYNASGPKIFRMPRITTTHTHGSGCSLSTAIAVGLASGLSLVTAIMQAKENVNRFIDRASKMHFVQHNGPLVHFSG